ncbi:Transmembrane protein [Orchesella cincta]|uniref:Transmembrane protein n=1 Tax=Orchesella cincta TaxID=48709 RepID=A0A1D2MGJ4_ORCCI|nr:Transmembrane protein [Orchesella cincta]
MDSDDSRTCLGQLNDPNVKITLGDTYFSSVEELGLNETWKNKSVLSIGDVKELWKLVKSSSPATDSKHGDKTKVFLHELLQGSELSIPGLEVPKRNPQLEKRIAELRSKLEEKEYQRMTRNVDTSSPYKHIKEDSVAYQMKQMNSGIVAVFQFVISLAAAFLFGFSGIQIFYGEMEIAVRLLLGIAFAIIVGVAELYILVVHLDAVEEQHAPIEKKSQ